MDKWCLSLVSTKNASSLICCCTVPCSQSQWSRFRRSNSLSSLTGYHRTKAVKLSFQTYQDTQPNSGAKQKSPVLILHGMLGSRNNWHSISKELNRSTGRKIISIDARNHGDSEHSDEVSYTAMAADIVSLMEDQHVKSASLLGHSMGGRVMMNVALNHPDLVDSLMVVDMSPNSHPSAASADIPGVVSALCSIDLSRLPSNQLAARQLTDEQLKQLIPSKMLRQFLLTNLVEYSAGIRWRFNLTSIANNLAAMAVGVTHPEGATYSGPCLFLGGEKSDYIRTEDCAGIRKLFITADIDWVPGAGHWVHSEKPAEFLSRAVSFLSQ